MNRAMIIIGLIIFLVYTQLFLSGCGSTKRILAGYNDVVNQIPDNEFRKFEYHRSGMYSSAHVVAKDAAKDGDIMMIDSVSIQLNYGPENLTMSIEGYIRENKDE